MISFARLQSLNIYENIRTVPAGSHSDEGALSLQRVLLAHCHMILVKGHACGRPILLLRDGSGHLPCSHCTGWLIWLDPASTAFTTPSASSASKQTPCPVGFPAFELHASCLRSIRNTTRNCRQDNTHHEVAFQSQGELRKDAQREPTSNQPNGSVPDFYWHRPAADPITPTQKPRKIGPG